ncbi:MAG: bifunctional hydroxymethylpyrimidine kinase/phosphomethylpyrimidine kinase [Candidatus Brocadiia bacterium]|jgi:hydroxymethylpyrimidine/phosphomethylpyrimidine kinase|nr:bifunctional hydroxymethylpyrimidine kinase/phosphomethylpyrimidine kinase [Candidatus Brocadiia bacterium]
MGEMRPRILAIAGSDSGGGAGIQADLKTITALGGFGMSALTALTAQNTLAVTAVHEVPPEFVAEQIDAVASDIGVDAAKTGMLGTAAIVEVVAERLGAHGIDRLVVDPVMVSKGGARLLEADAEETLRARLLPLALVATPNLSEAGVLAGMRVGTLDEMREAARRIAGLGSRHVLVKGGHLAGEPVDLLFDGRDFGEIVRPRIATENTHGTGCTYASAIATYIGFGMAVPDAIERARDAVQRGLEKALPFGSGHGPLDHRAMCKEHEGRDTAKEQE